MDFQTPILVIGFNRPDKLRKLLSILALKKPKCIYFSFDGPRRGNSTDKQLIAENLELINEVIDWTVFKLKHEPSNLGCKNHVLKAITWFFENEETGIILEDDCIPNLSFFNYADELLGLYKDDTRVGMISGNNHGMNKTNCPYDYYFTRYISIWGWATWKDRWQKFMDFLVRVNMPDSELVLCEMQHSIKASLRSEGESERRFSNMTASIQGKIDSWGYILSGFSLSTNLLTIVPNANMISNIGCGEDATHTKDELHEHANLEIFELEGDIKHPPYVTIDIEYDQWYPSRGKKEQKGIIRRLIQR